MEEIKKVHTLPLVKLNTRYKMVIPSFVEQKIRHLCNRIWEKEWSGTLFYKAEGSFEDGSLVITCADIFVMDIGSATYTEFDMSPDVITYVTEHPELMECQMALVHSHNRMSTFLSGTDMETLKEEGMDRNHFVSLIVNNAGSYTAAITRRIKSKRTINDNYSYESFEGTNIEAMDSHEEEVDELQYFYLDINKEGFDYTFSDIDARLDEIEKSKKAEKKFYSPKWDYNKEFSYNSKLTEQPELPFDTKEIKTSFKSIDGVVDEQEVKCNPEFIHSLCLQLLTGSIMIPNESKLDIKKWINSMNSVVERRFGTGKKGLDAYKSFIESFVEFIVWNSEDPTLVNTIDNDYMMTVVASDMYDYLDTLPQNIYIKICKEALFTYLS